MVARPSNGQLRLRLAWARPATTPSLVRRSVSAVEREEDDRYERRRSIGGQITFIFTIFSRNQNRYDIVGNEYSSDIPINSKTMLVDQKIYR
jgi:hypothetical protein